MTDEIPELSVPARHSFSDPNTALKFRDLLKEFADGIVQDSTVKDRYGYILDITQTGPEYPSSVIEITDETDAYGNPIDPVLAPNSIDNPERASYATVLTDDGFRIRARIAPSQIPAFRKAEFFDKFDPSGYGVMIDERGVYVNVVIEGGLSKIHPSSFPWLLDQGGEKVVVEPQVAPRVWVSGKAGQYYVVSVIRGETPSRIEYEYSKQDILKNIADIQEARFDLDQGAADLVQAQLEIEAAKQDIMDSQTSIIGAVNEATLARAEASAAFGQSSQATEDAQDAFNKAVEAEELAAQAAKAGAVVKIDSSRGVLFKSNEVSTILSVTVFKGAQIITDILDLQALYGAGAYLEWQWQLYDSEAWGTISSADSRLSAGGFNLTLGPADVDQKVVFRCSVNGDL